MRWSISDPTNNWRLLGQKCQNRLRIIFPGFLLRELFISEQKRHRWGRVILWRFVEKTGCYAGNFLNTRTSSAHVKRIKTDKMIMPDLSYLSDSLIRKYPVGWFACNTNIFCTLLSPKMTFSLPRYSLGNLRCTLRVPFDYFGHNLCSK